MPDSDDLQSREIVLRGLLRLPEELDPATGRPHQDKDDFIRRRSYQKNKPENGLSVFRRCKYPANENFYNRIGSKKPIGVTECDVSQLVKQGIKLILGEDKKHVSLRCADCDMASSPDICKPNSGASFDDCPFFDKASLTDLNSIFIETEAPFVRKVNVKSATGLTESEK